MRVQKRGAEVRREVGFHVSHPVGYQSVGRGVRFVEAVARETGDVAVEFLCYERIDLFVLGRLHEFLPLLLHLSDLLLRHDLPENVGVRHGVA